MKTLSSNDTWTINIVRNVSDVSNSIYVPSSEVNLAEHIFCSIFLVVATEHITSVQRETLQQIFVSDLSLEDAPTHVFAARSRD